MILPTKTGLKPRLRNLFAGFVCWRMGCQLRGQFCERCERFVP